MRDKLSYSEAGKFGAIESAKGSAERKQKRIDEWNANPKLCKQCLIPLSYDKRRNDFCSHSCGAIFNNSLKGYAANEILNACLYCFKILTKKGQHKYCSRECMFSFHWKETKENLLKDGCDNSAANGIGKKYLIELHQGKCQVCELSEWNGQKMPLVLDHINGNAYDNLLTNLRVICNNCDALSPTFKACNKGSGRFKRAELSITLN